jgi:hypothetical protein
MQQTRREFLADVGKGMLIASVGSGLAEELGVSPALAAEPEALSFGKLEPLVCLMQETAPDRLLPLLIERLAAGTELTQLLAAGALANARTFGGEDYVGFHTMMALGPAHHMARELPEERRALPVLKVLHRNSTRIQARGGRKDEVLTPVAPGTLPEGKPGSAALEECVHRKDMTGADRTFAALAQGSAEQALNDLLFTVQDCLEVHRVVLPYRAWDLLPIIGREHAHTLLRQSVHYCVRNESQGYREHYTSARTLLPKLLDQYRLPGKGLGHRPAEDAWVESLSQTIFKSTPEQAADAAAAALGEGMAPEAIGEAISLAVNQLVLRDEGRSQAEGTAKPKGSVHGDGIGVHACDAANAWRNLARVSSPRHTAACLILSAYQASMDRTDRGGEFLQWEPYPRAEARAKVKTTDPARLLQEAEAAIRNKDQALACAVVQRYGEQGHPARAICDLLLRYAISEDGALHAEKYYRTVTEEFASTRAAFRWRQLVALARVTASEYGHPAPGHAEACRLLKV